MPKLHENLLKPKEVQFLLECIRIGLEDGSADQYVKWYDERLSDSDKKLMVSAFVDDDVTPKLKRTARVKRKVKALEAEVAELRKQNEMLLALAQRAHPLHRSVASAGWRHQFQSPAEYVTIRLSVGDIKTAIDLFAISEANL